ncbi:MAG TPA: DUF3800 domain-containing protein [Rhizomicrobium sp.]|nr:DUF3800 domain-containing protein [Rhizomicrobium sp.]
MIRPLQGDRLVRIGFLDESGRSQFEPTLVVGGIVINGDRSYRAIRDHLDDIRSRHIPADDRAGFVFHAKDIFQGGGKYFHKRKDEWPRARRYALLQELADIPRKFSLPVCFAAFHKQVNDRHIQKAMTNVPEHRQRYVLDAIRHATAFAMATTAIDAQMRKFQRDEICMLIAEDTDSVKRAVKMAHVLLEQPEFCKGLPRPFPDYTLPITKVVDTPHFAAKTESPPLQVADTCAYLICRRLRREQETQEFFEKLSPQLTVTDAEFGEKMETEQMGRGQRI